MNLRLHRAECLKALAEAYPDEPEGVAGYVAEAEMADGQGYWRNFPTPPDAVEDYSLYRAYYTE